MQDATKAGARFGRRGGRERAHVLDPLRVGRGTQAESDAALRQELCGVSRFGVRLSAAVTLREALAPPRLAGSCHRGPDPIKPGRERRSVRLTCDPGTHGNERAESADDVECDTKATAASAVPVSTPQTLPAALKRIGMTFDTPRPTSMLARGRRLRGTRGPWLARRRSFP